MSIEYQKQKNKNSKTTTGEMNRRAQRWRILIKSDWFRKLPVYGNDSGKKKSDVVAEDLAYIVTINVQIKKKKKEKEKKLRVLFDNDCNDAVVVCWLLNVPATCQCTCNGVMVMVRRDMTLLHRRGMS